MSEMDCIAPQILNSQVLQAVSPGFLKERLLQAQQKSWQVLDQIKAGLREGMTEEDARKWALEVFKSRGVVKHWHRPVLRFGAGTLCTFSDPFQADYRLQQNDPVFIDLGPIWPGSELELQFTQSAEVSVLDEVGLSPFERGIEYCAKPALAYEGDVGDTFVFGVNPEAEACAQAARDIFHAVKAQWQAEALSGEQIYLRVQQQAEARGYVWVEKVKGHRIGDFPHHQYSKENLKSLSFSPQSCLWILEVQIKDPQGRFGAFFEDIL